ncbi:hypothetical protein LMH87_001972 [Akanthomyces muscarius]|uniref:Conidial development protein fluffy n=1 Tax=Akanthomyces muscarius TaxID=2231603 RepID=A0A9W8UIS4_AKAMU|nr:hypothetical protein LMH87_001972 [Akanthomyces muscarius]KAJ4147457.1 hypothetical protein LMH87_001972 [Akanthomyces muscarius]
MRRLTSLDTAAQSANYAKPKPQTPEKSTNAVEENEGRSCKIEESPPIIDNQTRFTTKDARPLYTDNHTNIEPIDPEVPIPSIESPTSQSSFSIASISDKDDLSDVAALRRPPPYTSRRWPPGRALPALDSILQWDCIAFCIIDGVRFKSDLLTGSNKYCSPALVDALLALSVAVFRHDISEDISGSEAETPAWEIFSVSLADEVIQALQRGAWLPKAIPDIQALGVLALHCACNGWRDKSRDFAMEFAEAIRTYCLQNTGSDGTVETMRRITASTYCGAISLNRMMVQIQEYDATLPRRSGDPRANLAAIENENMRGRRSWTENRLRATLISEPFVNSPDLHGRDIYGIAAQLYQLVELVFKTCCELENNRTFANATATYTKCLEWYRNFFRCSKAYTSREPLILFVHTYYHFCILSLFTPYVTNEALVFDGSSPGKICEEAANIILKLMKHHECLAGDTEPVGFMSSFNNASLEFLHLYNSSMR